MLNSQFPDIYDPPTTYLKLLECRQPFHHNGLRFRPVLGVVNLLLHAPPTETTLALEVFPIVHLRCLITTVALVEVVRLADCHRCWNDFDFTPK